MTSSDSPPNISSTPLPPTPPDALPPNTSRLSIPFPARLPLLALLASTSGLFLGLAHGSTETGLRFRAENAHRLPTTQTGWYLYHKSKNYHVILGSLKEGMKMGAKMAFWSALFVVMEEGVDRGRAAGTRAWREHAPSWQGEDGVDGEEGREREVEIPRDFVSTTFAGLGAAGFFSVWEGFPLPTAVRMMKMGGKAGLAFGLLQDGISWARGRRLGYVEFVKRHMIGRGEVEVDGKDWPKGRGAVVSTTLSS